MRDGFAILKVGPELTFVLREALYSLDLIASDLLPDYGDRPLYHAMEAVMLADPGYWNHHYSGSDTRLLRHYSLSDRVRYYWTNADVQAAVDRLIKALTGQTIPITLFWQHMPAAAHFADIACDLEDILIWCITQCLATYHSACGPDA